MPEHLAHDLRMHTTAERDRRERVAQVVKPDPPEADAAPDLAKVGRWTRFRRERRALAGARIPSANTAGGGSSEGCAS